MARRKTYKFRLYIAGTAENSVQARANLDAVCEAHLKGHFDIEVVDVLIKSKRALADGILMTPTLVKVAPAPVRTIVGTLSDTEPLLRALGLTAVLA